MENPEYLEYLYYTQYWDAFIFWADRTWTLHEGSKFSLVTLRNSIAAEGLLEAGTRSKRIYCNDVGLPELRMLIDHDILHTGSQEWPRSTILLGLWAAYVLFDQAASAGSVCTTMACS